MLDKTERLVSSVGDQLFELIAARQAHDEARDLCQVDWDYFGHHERERVKRAEQALAVALDDYIADFFERKMKDV